MLYLAPPLRMQGVHERSLRLVDALFSSLTHIPDIMCFQEMSCYTENITSQLPLHPYHSTPSRANIFSRNMKFKSSGLMIVSQYPIIFQREHVFTGRTYKYETLAAKSVMYCCVLLPSNQHIHIFNTHLQAWSSPTASAVRESQTKQITKFMKDMNIPTHEVVLLAGDFNVDAFECPGFYTLMAKSSQMEYCSKPCSKQIFSFDNSTNSLVGVDDPHEYVHKKNASSSTAISAGLPPAKLIDMILCKNLTSYTFHVDRVKASCHFWCFINLTTRVRTRDISDHYPVTMRCTMPKYTSIPLEISEHVDQNSTDILVVLLFTVINIACLLMACTTRYIWRRYKKK